MTLIDKAFWILSMLDMVIILLAPLMDRQLEKMDKQTNAFAYDKMIPNKVR